MKKIIKVWLLLLIILANSNASFLKAEEPPMYPMECKFTVNLTQWITDWDYVYNPATPITLFLNGSDQNFIGRSETLTGIPGLPITSNILWSVVNVKVTVVESNSYAREQTFHFEWPGNEVIDMVLPARNPQTLEP